MKQSTEYLIGAGCCLFAALIFMAIETLLYTTILFYIFGMLNLGFAAEEGKE